MLCGRLPALRSNCNQDFAEQSQMNFAFGHGFVLTGRGRPLHKPDALRSESSRGMVVASPGELPAALVFQQVNELHAMTTSLLEQLERIEDRIFDESRTAERQYLMAARRQRHLYASACQVGTALLRTHQPHQAGLAEADGAMPAAARRSRSGSGHTRTARPLLA